jgi:hypothetical protein
MFSCVLLSHLSQFLRSRSVTGQILTPTLPSVQPLATTLLADTIPIYNAHTLSCINFVFRATGFHFDSLNPEDGTGRLYRNVGKKLATTCRVITEKTLLSINKHVKLSYFGHIQGDTQHRRIQQWLLNSLISAIFREIRNTGEYNNG